MYLRHSVHLQCVAIIQFYLCTQRLRCWPGHGGRVRALFIAATPGDNDKPYRKNLSNISLLEVVSVVQHRGDIASFVRFSAICCQ